MAHPSLFSPSSKAGGYRRRKKNKNCGGAAPSHSAVSAAPSLERSRRGPYTSPPLLLELRGTVLGSSRLAEWWRHGALVSTAARPPVSTWPPCWRRAESRGIGTFCPASVGEGTQTLPAPSGRGSKQHMRGKGRKKRGGQQGQLKEQKGPRHSPRGGFELAQGTATKVERRRHRLVLEHVATALLDPPRLCRSLPLVGQHVDLLQGLLLVGRQA